MNYLIFDQELPIRTMVMRLIAFSRAISNKPLSIVSFKWTSKSVVNLKFVNFYAEQFEIAS